MESPGIFEKKPGRKWHDKEREHGRKGPGPACNDHAGQKEDPLIANIPRGLDVDNLHTVPSDLCDLGEGSAACDGLWCAQVSAEHKGDGLRNLPEDPRNTPLSQEARQHKYWEEYAVDDHGDEEEDHPEEVGER